MLRRLSFIALVIALGVLISGLPGASQAAALKCSRIIKQNGREFLINSCDACRIVSIQRQRPGADAPISRTVTIPQKSKVTLSFRGPGHSRITSDVPCKQASGGQSARPGGPQGDGKQCIGLRRTGNNGLALANSCNRCRTAIIERLDGRGGKKMQSVVIAAGRAVALPSKGAAYARILMEKNCK